MLSCSLARATSKMGAGSGGLSAWEAGVGGNRPCVMGIKNSDVESSPTFSVIVPINVAEAVEVVKVGNVQVGFN